MASGSKKKNRNKKQQRKPHNHLPKVGTPADNAYLQRESRRDLVDFGVTPRKRGPANMIIVIAVLAVLALGVVGLLILTA
jgi:hypothetical protein